MFAVACRPKAAALETTIGKLASLPGLPSEQANRSTISEWDLARVIVTPLLSTLSPSAPGRGLPHEAVSSARNPSEAPSVEGPASEALSSQGHRDAAASAMSAEIEEQAVWPADSMTVCHGALWQIEGCDAEHVHIKEVWQGNDPLNIGMFLPLRAFASLATFIPTLSLGIPLW